MSSSEPGHGDIGLDDRLIGPAVDEPADDAMGADADLVRARAWYAIQIERLVDEWMVVVAPVRLDDVPPAFLRSRLHGFLRGIITALFTPPFPLMVQSFGRELAGLCASSADGLHLARTGLQRALTDGMPDVLLAPLSDPIERVISDIAWGFAQGALARDPTSAARSAPLPLYSLTGDDTTPVEPDLAWCQTFVDQYPYAVMIDDIVAGETVAASAHFKAVTGYTAEEYLAIPFHELLGDGAPDDDFDLAYDLIDGRVPVVERMTEYRQPDGGTITVDIRIWVLRGSDGTARFLVSEFRQRLDEERFWQATDRRFRHLAQLTHDAVLVVGPDGRIRYASPTTERLLGMDPADLGGKPVVDLAYPDDRPALAGFVAGLTGTAPRRSDVLTIRLDRRDGLWRWFELTGANLLDVPGLDGITLQARDITTRKELEAVLEEQALLDPLTGVRNRRGIHRRLEQEIARYDAGGLPVAVFCLDMDGFKAINDGYGHAAGDALLVEAARRMAERLGAESLVGRLGGDEFVVVLPGATPDSAVSVARQLNAAVREPFLLADSQVAVGCQVGVVLTERPGHTVTSLIAAADRALYRAKASRDGEPVMGYDQPADVPGMPVPPAHR